jgi:MYXO-CTERM domain-containing protein
VAVIRSWTTALAAVAALCATAQAEVVLPSGQTVPIASGGGEVQVSALLAGRGEALDWIVDAHATPDTFSPLCGFSASLLLHEAGSNYGVGWYNVVPNASAAPPVLEIYQVVAPGAAVGSVVTGASIRSDPNYLGGLIGFALLRTFPSPPHYSESKWNTLCNAGPCAPTPGPWIMSVTYQSTQLPNSYYLAFEDGNVSSSGWTNDGDYNDYVFLFTGLACAGAGEPCAVTGAQGVCAAGLTECDSTGAVVCKQLTQPAAEACDGVDNDCNGSSDDGDGLCEPGEQCVRGNCVPFCGDEFPCLAGDVCENQVCVHPACVGKTCDAGQACRAGLCVAPCDGVVCPGSQVCQVGVCVEPCGGVVCPEGRVCDGGVCVLDCDCAGCEPGEACQLATGLCVTAGCELLSCSAEQKCAAGACVDACDGAVCPAGQACSAGRCEAAESSDDDAGVGAGASGGVGGAGGAGGGAGMAPVPGMAGAGGGVGTRRDGVAEGCSCSAPGGTSRAVGGAWLTVAALLGALGARRRRRR